MDKSIELGRQSGGDNPFGKRMRLHQSWFRKEVLKVPCGKGPTQDSKYEYGNIIDKEYDKDDAGREIGLNFLESRRKEILEEVQKRLNAGYGTIEEYRLKYNMLSSQPMCFNLFVPLMKDLEKGNEYVTCLINSILPVKIKIITEIKIEYPNPRLYLKDRTAFDAFIEFEAIDGKMGFIGIETKLAESFSDKEYPPDKYIEWKGDELSPWNEHAWDEFSNKKYNQLWRDHLLAIAMMRKCKNPLYKYGYFLLLAHELDDECWDAADDYKKLLKSKETYIELKMCHFIERIVECNGNEELWIKDFKKRYLDLHLSSHLPDNTTIR